MARNVKPLLTKYLFGLLVAYGIVLLIMLARQGISVETDMQALIPVTAKNAPVKKANSVLDRQYGDLVVLLLVDASKEHLQQAESAVSTSILSNSQLVRLEESGLLQNYLGLADFYRPYRFNLLSAEQRKVIAEQGAKPVIQTAWQRLLGFYQSGLVASFAEDPLSIYNDFFLSLPVFQGNSDLEDGFIKLDADVKQYGKPIIIKLKGKSLDLTVQRELVDFFDSLQARLGIEFPNMAVYRSGVIFHAEQAARNSKREFSVISTISIVFIVGLMLLCFRSIRPLLLSIASIAFGFLSALIVCGALFKNLHLMTLVFGAGLIGVVVDYALHYFANEQFGSNKQVSTITKIFPSLAMGLVTTVAGYACLYQTSLPGLTQIASFCIIGLISAWLFVVVLFPRFEKRSLAELNPVISKSANIFSALWSGLGLKKSAAVLLVLVPACLLSIVLWGSASNNVRLLYSPPPAILQQDVKISELLKQRSINQYLLVTADSEQGLLQREESLRLGLNRLINEGALSSYMAISQYVPSIVKQKENHNLLNAKVYSVPAVQEEFFTAVGVGSETRANIHAALAAADENYLEIAEFLEQAPAELRLLWLDKVEGIFASIVLLAGIQDIAAIASLSETFEDVLFIDRVAAITNLLKMQFSKAAYMLGLAYLLIAGIIFLRYKQKWSLTIALVPLLSLLFALAVLSACSVSVGLFHVLALYLALGLGLDYGIFLYDSKASAESRLAVWLSAMTSMLSFGLLSFSSMPMISAFGVTLLLSVLSSLVIAPLLIFWAHSRSQFRRL